MLLNFNTNQIFTMHNMPNKRELAFFCGGILATVAVGYAINRMVVNSYKATLDTEKKTLGDHLGYPSIDSIFQEIDTIANDGKSIAKNFNDKALVDNRILLLKFLGLDYKAKEFKEYKKNIETRKALGKNIGKDIQNPTKIPVRKDTYTLRHQVHNTNASAAPGNPNTDQPDQRNSFQIPPTTSTDNTQPNPQPNSILNSSLNPCNVQNSQNQKPSLVNPYG